MKRLTKLLYFAILNLVGLFILLDIDTIVYWGCSDDKF